MRLLVDFPALDTFILDTDMIEAYRVFNASNTF